MLRLRTGSLQRKSTLRERDPFHPCPRSPDTKRQRVWPVTEEMKMRSYCTVNLLIVPGAQNFVRMLQASNFTHSAWYTELYLSAWGTWGLKCHWNWHWIPQVRLFIFAILLHSKSELGYYFSLHFILSISNCTIVFFLFSKCKLITLVFLQIVVLATLSSMQLYCTMYWGVLYMWTCWIQTNTAKFWLGKGKFPPQCPKPLLPQHREIWKFHPPIHFEISCC